MKRNLLIILAVIALVSFAGGFFLANTINKNEISALQIEIGKLREEKSQNPSNSQEMNLSDEEITEKIKEADSQPQNIEFQKNLAFGLYRYSVIKKESKWFSEIIRLMNRVYEKNPKDFETVALLGSLHFDLGASKSDNENFKKARDYYQKALEIKPNEVELLTDLGVTYLLTQPAEPEKAISEFQKSLQINPKHEKTLQNMIQAQIGIGKKQEAENFLKKLKEINPQNEEITELSSKIGTAKQ